MKVTIDNERKTVTVEEEVNLQEFFDFVKKCGIDMKEYKLITNSNYYINPVVNYGRLIPEYISPTIPNQPSWWPQIIY